MVRLAALGLTVLTGFSGLVYEVAWQRYLAMLLGSHGEATAAVLAIFLGGLSAGYALFGAWTRRWVARARAAGAAPRLLLGYAGIEAGIGAWALAFPVLFTVAQRASLFVPPGREALGFAFDVGLSALLIGPPAVLMGGTIPMLTLALAGDPARATRVHAWIYGFNTLGAFAGALAAGFWIVPSLGLDGTLRAVAWANLLAGAGFAALDRVGASVAPDLSAEAAPAAPAPRFAAYGTVALLLGFAMMAVQTTLNRVGGLALGSSTFTFAMMVAVFVLAIALGSLAVSLLPRVPAGLFVAAQAGLFALLLLLYIVIPDAPYAAHVVRTLFQSVGPAFYAYHLAVFLALLAVLIVPVGLSGALLPLLFDRVRRDAGALGSAAGRLYAWNTVGSLAGALLGGYLLLIWLDLHHVWRIALAAIAASTLISATLLPRGPSRAAAAALWVPIAASLLLLPTWDPMRIAVGLFRYRSARPQTYDGPSAFYADPPARTVFYDDDPTSTVNVTQSEGAKSLNLLVNGKSDGNLIEDHATAALLALFPAWMAARSERCFVIGLGTGISAGELAALDETRTVDVAEISRGVIAAAPLFDVGNLAASRSPKVRVHRGDAYRTLQQSSERYDVIVSEPSNPWVTGVEMLYSVEFLEAVRSHLAPGGVYAQWFHTYETDADTVDLVLRSAAAVFPHLAVWYTLATDLLILGFDDPDRALDLATLEARFAHPEFRAAFARSGIQNFGALLAHELLPIGTVQVDAIPGPLHTLRHPILSDAAARGFFVGGPGRLPRFAMPPSAEIGARNSLLRRWAGLPDGSLREDALAAATAETCRQERGIECGTLLARWKFDHPDSPQLAATLEAARKDSVIEELLDAPRLAELVLLFDDGSRLGATQRPLRRAQNLSRAFAVHYTHSVPFDRRMLDAVWRECLMPACVEARRGFEERLGRL